MLTALRLSPHAFASRSCEMPFFWRSRFKASTTVRENCWDSSRFKEPDFAR